MKIHSLAIALAAATAAAAPAHAALMTFQNFTGSVGYSSDGVAARADTDVSTVSASIPNGATVTAAYLYASTFNSTFFNTPPTGVTLDGNAVNFSSTAPNTPSGFLSSHRADVTSIVQNRVGMGSGVFDFDYAETANAGSIDGSALVVVYDDPTVTNRTVAILDGFSATAGDTALATFAAPIDTTVPGFSAELALGIGFSFNNGPTASQFSTVDINGQRLTDNAGNFDDGFGSNGGLITVGGFDDAFSPNLPALLEDTERYDLTPFISQGDTSLRIDTRNPSSDDNIFLAIIDISAEATVTNPIPLPAGGWLLISALGAVGLLNRRRALAK